MPPPCTPDARRLKEILDTYDYTQPLPEAVRDEARAIETRLNDTNRLIEILAAHDHDLPIPSPDREEALAIMDRQIAEAKLRQQK